MSDQFKNFSLRVIIFDLEMCKNSEKTYQGFQKSYATHFNR